MGYTAIVVGDGAARIEPDRPVVVADGAVELACALIGGRTGEENRGKISPEIVARLDQGRAAADHGIERQITLTLAGVHLSLCLCAQGTVRIDGSHHCSPDCRCPGCQSHCAQLPPEVPVHIWLKSIIAALLSFLPGRRRG